MAVLVLATQNEGKVRELRAMLADSGIEVRSLADFPPGPEVVEDGETFVANALKKARAAAATTGLPALADDSGLEVDALGGEPGVYSARYGGPGLDDEGRCHHLLQQLAARGLTASPGRFRCAMALVTPDGRERTCEAAWEGVIHGPLRGANGFGYDPLFELPGEQRTSAMLPPDEKNRRSHRGQALARMVDLLRSEPDLLATVS